jgi:multidrug resistance efflux pump
MRAMASGPYSAPWSDTGRLQGDIDRVASDVRGKVDRYELDQTNRNVDSVERELREVRSEIDGLRLELQEIQEGHRQVLDVLSQMTTVI